MCSMHTVPDPDIKIQCCLPSGFEEGARAGLAWGTATAMVQTLEIFAGQVSGTSRIQDQVIEGRVGIGYTGRARLLDRI